MADEAFLAEVREAQAARWRRTKLLQHTRKHRPEFQRYLGRPLAPGEVEELSRQVLQSRERVFTGLQPDGAVTYVFAGVLEGSRATMVVVSREGLIRTLFVAEELAWWLDRHPELVEVTDRARRLGG